jgi:hypothetical protein
MVIIHWQGTSSAKAFFPRIFGTAIAICATNQRARPFLFDKEE